MMEKGARRRGLVWALSSDDAVYYHLNRSRSAEVIKGLLGNYKQSAHHRRIRWHIKRRQEEVRTCSLRIAWHVRRKYLERSAYPQCQQALDLIRKAYDIERNSVAERTPQRANERQALCLRAEVRRRDSVPILGELPAWALSQHALPRVCLRKRFSTC